MTSSNKAAFARRPVVSRSVVLLAASMLSLTATSAAFAQALEANLSSQPSTRGQVYRPVPAAAPDLAQIVFFRSAQAPAANGPAHVYVNGEFEGSVMPNGYTRFCVRQGIYSLEAYTGDAPRYAGKTDPKTEINVEGGGTYFIGVSENGSGEPVPFRRADAERLLRHSREQVHVINRASAVVPCGDQPHAVAAPAADAPLRFRLDSAVLFDFGQSDPSAITTNGRNEIKKVAEQILALPQNSVTRVTVQGHADPIGNALSNQKLSEARARTVSQVLSENGIPAGVLRTEGLGSSKPVVRCPPSGDKAKRVSCNAPNRRVEIVVERTQTNGEAVD